MKGIFINCPSKDCKKMLLKNVVLRTGTRFTLKCFHCGAGVSVEAQQGNIQLKLLTPVVDIAVDNSADDDDDDDGVVFL